VAGALAGDHALKRIPVMRDIVGITLAAWADGPGAEPVEEAQGNGAEALLANSGLRAAFLDGYLTAYVIAPVAPPPEVWLGALLGGIEFPGDGAVNRIMAAISDRIEQMDTEAPDPSVMATRLTHLSPDASQNWCAGFHALVSAAPRRVAPPAAWAPKTNASCAPSQMQPMASPTPALLPSCPPGLPGAMPVGSNLHTCFGTWSPSPAAS
jgi:hypothetical protein